MASKTTAPRIGKPPSSKKSSAASNGSNVKHASPKASAKKFCASIYPGNGEPLPGDFVDLVKKLEAKLSMPIWLIVHGNGIDKSKFNDIAFDVFKGFQRSCHEFKPNSPCGLLLESPGGDAHSAYRIARLFQRRCSEFTVIIPQ